MFDSLNLMPSAVRKVVCTLISFGIDVGLRRRARTFWEKLSTARDDKPGACWCMRGSDIDVNDRRTDKDVDRAEVSRGAAQAIAGAANKLQVPQI